MSMAGNARRNRVCSFVATLISYYQWLGSTDLIEDPGLPDATAYPTQWVIHHQEWRDTLISAPMSKVGPTIFATFGLCSIPSLWTYLVKTTI